MSVKITKDGFYYAENDIFDGTEKPINPSGKWLFRLWQDEVYVEDLTLLDLVRMLQGMDTDVVANMEDLCGSRFTRFFPEIEEDDKSSGISCIRVYKIYETMDVRKYGGGRFIQDYACCDGVGKELREDGKPELYGLNFSAWSEIKDLPIVIDRSVELWIDDLELGEMPRLHGKYDTRISLGEFFDGLFDELAFFGSPERRKSELDGLRKSVREIEDGTAKLIPWEEVRDEFMKEKEEGK